MDQPNLGSSARVSVVIASGAEGDFLLRCLDSLREQSAARGTDVIVVDRCGGEKLARLKREHNWVTVIQAELDHHPSVPELRALGVPHAQGDILAVIEEHCVAPSHWLQAIQGSFRGSDVAIGGPILDDNYDRVRDWVVYFSEYHNYLPPWTEGERYGLNGANIAYRRQTLLNHQDVLSSGYWEVVLHPQLAAEGFFRAVPQMGVRHTGPFGYRYYLQQRYLLSRVWGGMQRDRVSWRRRMAYLVAAPALPFLLLVRIIKCVLASRQLFRRLLISLPLMMPVVVAYAWGEWLGYLLGAGSALEEVE